MSDEDAGAGKAELGLFTVALGLGDPWQVRDANFAEDEGQLDLQVSYRRGARFACPEPGCSQRECPVHDTQDVAASGFL